MLDNFRKFLTAPVFEDEEVTRLAGLFYIILLVTFGVAVVTCIGMMIITPDEINQLAVMAIILPLILFVIYLVRLGRVDTGIKIFTISLWLVLSMLTIVFGGIHTPAFTSYILVIVIAGLLWSGMAGLFFAFLTVAFGLSVAILEELGMMVPPIFISTPLTIWFGQTANFLLIAFFLYQMRDSLNSALHRARNEVENRKEVEAALRQGQMQMRHILDTVPEGVLLLAHDGRINMANPVAEAHLAILAPDRSGNRLVELGDKPLEKLFTSPPKGLWHEIKAKDALFEAIAKPVENTVQNQGWVLVLRDVTQEREIQRQIQQQERLAAVGQLAAGIAHDFNNIMAVIILYAQMIARQDDLNPNGREKLETIRQQGQRAAELIQQILDFSRQSVLDRKPLEVAPFLKEIVKMLSRTLRENIDIQFKHDDGDFLIYVDPPRIQQVLMNMAVNARDAMPNGGQLSINLERIEILTRKDSPLPDMDPGSWVVIKVADSGSGISSEAISRIFEPFYSTKELGKGTGLGLAQVYGIMKQHAAHLDVRSEVDKGTTFFLYFPAYKEEHSEVTQGDITDLPLGQGQTILLVEDNEATREALVDSLEMLNYIVIESENGREALEILAKRRSEIDLIISDAVMPQMGGSALLRAIRGEKISIPMIILTGHPLTSELDELQREGLNAWLLKPPSLEEIARVLTNIWAEGG